jgi:VanZ family protein
VLRTIWAAWAAIVTIATLLPSRSPVIALLDTAGINDKVEHFAAYAALGALPAMDGFGGPRVRFLVFGLVLLLGGLLEILQKLSPGRSCDWLDFAADTGGALAGAALVRLTFLRRF